MLCLVSAFPECLALFVWNPVWFPKLSFPIAYAQKESCIFYLDFPGFVDLCLLSKWVLTEVLILQIISRSLVFIEIDTTWLLSIKGVLGGNSFNSQTFCSLYSFQKGYIYLFYFKNWEEEHTCKDVCVEGAQMSQHAWRSEDNSGVSSFLPSVHYGDQFSLLQRHLSRPHEFFF